MEGLDGAVPLGPCADLAPNTEDSGPSLWSLARSVVCGPPQARYCGCCSLREVSVCGGRVRFLSAEAAEGIRWRSPGPEESQGGSEEVGGQD